MVDQALIYAAGFGTRMGALTADRPKPLLKLGKATLIDQLIAVLCKGAISRFHINTHYLSQQIAEHFASDERVKIHDEPDGPYETGGTLKSLARELPESVLTTNSDMFFMGVNPVDILRGAWRDELDALLLLAPKEAVEGHKGAGDFFIDEGCPIRRGDAESAPYIFAGMQIIRPQTAQAIRGKKFSNNVIWDALIAKGKVGVAIYPDRFIDVGNQASLELARREMGG